MNMNCEIFREHLDQYIDSELSGEIRFAMEEHAGTCAQCAELLNSALALATACAELNEGLTVPLACQAAWREAVREKAASKHAHRGAWTRVLSAAAAVLILAVTITSQTDMGALLSVNKNYSITATDSSGYSGRAPQMPGYSATSGSGESAKDAGSFLLQSDGATNQDMTVRGSAEDSDIVVLRSAVRAIGSDSFDSDTAWLEDLVSEYSAYFEDRRVTGQAEDDSRVLRATIRVPSESLDDFLVSLDMLGTITLREEYAEDITDRYNDVNTRLEVLRSQLAQLTAMNETAQSVDDLIAINERTTEVLTSIESYESTLRGWNSRKNYSAVTVTLTECAEEIEEEEQPLTDRMKDAFNDSVKWLGEFGQGAAVFAAALLPRLAVWGPVAIIVILLLRIAFKRKKK